MIAWDDALVKELAARRCLIFLGAGASAGCKSADRLSTPPSWESLLERLWAKAAARSTNAGIVNRLMSERRFLDAAEVIVRDLSPPAYVATMRAIFEQPRFEPSDVHRAVLEIDPKIVITTNFDTIYDHYCRNGKAIDGYNVFKYHDNHIVSDLRTPIRCIIKAHGCITNPDKMVLTRSHYFGAKQDAPHFFKVLDALFLTHTILFIGYSLSDPDIQLTLENANIAAKSSSPHYFVAEKGTHPALRSAAERAYNLRFVEFDAGDFSALARSLEDLADRVRGYRSENPDG